MTKGNNEKYRKVAKNDVCGSRIICLFMALYCFSVFYYCYTVKSRNIENRISGLMGKIAVCQFGELTKEELIDQIKPPLSYNAELDALCIDTWQFSIGDWFDQEIGGIMYRNILEEKTIAEFNNINDLHWNKGHPDATRPVRKHKQRMTVWGKYRLSNANCNISNSYERISNGAGGISSPAVILHFRYLRNPRFEKQSVVVSGNNITVFIVRDFLEKYLERNRYISGEIPSYRGTIMLVDTRRGAKDDYAGFVRNYRMQNELHDKNGSRGGNESLDNLSARIRSGEAALLDPCLELSDDAKVTHETGVADQKIRQALIRMLMRNATSRRMLKQ